MSDQNPATKKQSKMGEAWAARALMEKFGFKSVEEMEAALGARPIEDMGTTTVTMGSGDWQVTTSESGTATVPGVGSSKDAGTDPTPDPLSIITAKTPFVEIVSGTQTFVLRQRNRFLQPPVERIALRAYRAAPWYACPFLIGDPTDHVNDNNLKVMKGNWHHHRVTREMATLVYGDERIPRPETTVIDPKEFRGWDRHQKRPLGKHEPITEFVPLRELVRYLLQKAADTFMNYAVRADGFDFDPRAPNPYRDKISTIGSVKLK